MPSRIAGTYKEWFEHPKVVEMRRLCESVADLSRAMDAAKDAAIRDTDTMDEAKVAARAAFVETSNRLIHARMMVELGYLFDHLKDIVTDE